MKVKRYISDFLDCNEYLIYNDKYTIIVDPCVPYQNVKKDIKGELIAILITHGHYDHFKEINSYLENTNALIYLHQNAISKLEHASKNYSLLNYLHFEVKCDERYITITEGELVLKDNLKIKVLETFGHTNCSLTYIIDDLLFTGDFLFKNSIGRTDLLTGDSIKMNLSILKFKDHPFIKEYYDYVLYPGHDDITTLRDEFKNNSYLN